MGVLFSTLTRLFRYYVYSGNGSTSNVENKVSRINSKNKNLKLHVKCRNADPNNNNFPYEKDMKSKIVIRQYIPDDKVHWDVEWFMYKPEEYTGNNVLKKPVWADPEDTKGLMFNEIDKEYNTDRTSFTGNYQIDRNNRPLNPVGRTGISGRGRLGKWGPNHAADPIVTRWKTNESNKIEENNSSGKPILQFASIQRKDTGEWAIPGGMVDPGENVTVTVKREFMEEAINSLEKTPKEREILSKQLDKLFKEGVEIYRGYVDDPRNTDNAWMETVAFNFHDVNNEVLKDIKLQAGDDAGKVKWMDVDSSLKLYASHKDWIEKVAQMHNAHW